jgi:hypothetical protein
MKSPIRFIPLVLLAASAHAATHAVLPGASIQAKINLAVAGDIVAIFGGIYNEDITINKAIRLVEVSGQQVTLAGNVTFSGVSNCPSLDGFTVNSPGRRIWVSNTTGLVLRNLDGKTGSGVYVDGTSNLKIVNCQTTDVAVSGITSIVINECEISNFTTGGTTAELTKTSVAGGVNHTGGDLTVAMVTVAGNFDTQSAAQKTVAFRTIVSGYCHWSSKKSWFGYGKTRSFNFFGSDANVFFVGGEIDQMGASFSGVWINGFRNKCAIVNSIIKVGQSEAIKIDHGDCDVMIANNYLSTSHVGQPWQDRSIRTASAKTKIINNIFPGSQHSDWHRHVNAPFGAEISGNIVGSSAESIRYDGGVTPGTGNFSADPLFVENEDPKLQLTSPCLNAGIPDPRYNNRDGSRNTIGPSGGPWIDPDGWTTENPVVISFDLSPDMVLEGVDTEVILSEGQAVSAP